MSLRPYKFLVLPVFQVVDEEGVVVGERQPDQPDTVFGIEALQRWADGFEAQFLAAQQTQQIASQDGRPPEQED
jgi:hypothetical protein